MRAILIDPELQTVTEIQISGVAREIYELLGNRPFLQVRDYLNDSDLLMVGAHTLGAEGAAFAIDAPGAALAIDVPRAAFVIDAPSVPITGRGLALGNDSAGESCDVNISLDELRKRITFTASEDPIFYQ